MATALKKRSVLPGFGLALGYTVLYLSLIVLIPLAATFLKASSLSWPQFWHIAGIAARAGFVSPDLRSVIHRRLRQSGLRRAGRVGAGALQFPRQTSVRLAGRSSVRFADGGCRHRTDHDLRAEWLAGPAPGSLGIKSAYSPLGVAIALTFIGLPFVVRSVQPVLEDMEKELEEAAASLGASRWQTFSRVVLPTILPAALAGFAMAFARAVGEYGSVVFIAGNMPMKTEITPLLIITKLDQYDYAGATAIAVVMLVVLHGPAAAYQSIAEVEQQPQRAS
jgi:sulfate transport system permease protein